MKPICALTIPLAAGCIASPAIANDRTPIKTDAFLPAETIGHIYYNILTGEKIATSFNNSDTRPAAGNESFEVWVADNTLPCADFGQPGGNAVIIDNPNGEAGLPVSEGNTILDWADIAADTVVDVLQFSYFNTIQDVDLDSDGIGDGIEGFAMQWIFTDADNGFDACSCLGCFPIVGFTIVNLSGQLDGGFGGYTLTLDLVGSFNSSIAFEIGDTDSDLQSAAIHNPMFNYDSDSNGFGDTDYDQDGLADFSYSISYIQPGRIDLDNADGDSDTTTGIDGDPANAGLTAAGLAHYRGETIETDNGDGTFSYEVLPAPGVNAFGAEDAFDIFGSNGSHTGTFWFDGFTCNDPDDGTMNPFAQVELTMFGPTPSPCLADVTGDGTQDVLDVFAFLTAYNAAQLPADYAQPYGTLDIADVFAFLAAYDSSPCP